MARLMPLVWFVGLGCFLVCLAGYYEGMELWLGWGFVPALLVMVLAFFLGNLGGLFITIVGFFGMWKGFGWEWWQASLVAFPSVALMVVIMLGSGAVSALSVLRRR